MPIVGVPSDWKEYALMGLGVFLIILGFSLRRSSYYRKIARGNGELGTDSFVESQQSLLDYSKEESNKELAE